MPWRQLAIGIINVSDRLNAPPPKPDRGDGAGGNARRSAVMARDTLRRLAFNAGARGAALADRAAGWRRSENSRPTAVHSFASRSDRRARSRIRSDGESDANEEPEPRTAQETVEALTSARGAGERARTFHSF
jgi:hypothetical protein